MCRDEEHALHLAVVHHPDSRSWSTWSTCFDQDGQGALYSDVRSYADDGDGIARLLDDLAGDVVRAWFHGIAGLTVDRPTT